MLLRQPLQEQQQPRARARAPTLPPRAYRRRPSLPPPPPPPPPPRQSTTRVTPCICTMPLRLDEGWNQVQFNLADFTRRAYGTNYVETLRVQVHANCRLRRIFFCDRLYADEELPNEYKIYKPVQVGAREGGRESGVRGYLSPPAQRARALRIATSLPPSARPHLFPRSARRRRRPQRQRQRPRRQP